MTDPPENWQPSTNGPLGTPISLGDVVPIEPVYVERPLLQAATFHLVAGKLGIGKGALIMRWLARCTNGEMYGRPRNALLLASEEDARRDLFPRISVAGGDPHRLKLIPNNFLLPRDIEWLHDYALEVGDVGVIGLDPLSNHIGGTNSNADEEVRNALQPLAGLAGDLDTVIAGVRHVSSKDTKGGFVMRILGSTAWPAVARVVIGVAVDAEGLLHVRAVKGNRLRTEEAGRRYHLESAQFLDWKESVVVAVEDGESLVDIDTLLEGRRESNSERARQEIVRIIRDAGGQLESDIVDGRVAEATGMVARSIRDLRMELRDRGWIRHVRVDNPDGTIDHWEVALTSFAPPDPLTPISGESGVTGVTGYMSFNPESPHTPQSPENTHRPQERPSQESPANDQTRQIPHPSKPDFWEVKE